MSEWSRPGGGGNARVAQPRVRRAEVPRVEAYETDSGTVIFDGENPLAWVHSSVAVPIHQQA